MTKAPLNRDEGNYNLLHV